MNVVEQHSALIAHYSTSESASFQFPSIRASYWAVRPGVSNPSLCVTVRPFRNSLFLWSDTSRIILRFFVENTFAFLLLVLVAGTSHHLGAVDQLFEAPGDFCVSLHHLPGADSHRCPCINVSSFIGIALTNSVRVAADENMTEHPLSLKPLGTKKQ